MPNSTDTTKHDLHADVAVIGAGTAGLAAYRAVKAAGKNALHRIYSHNTIKP